MNKLNRTYKKAVKLYVNGYNFEYIKYVTGLNDDSFDKIVEGSKNKNMPFYRKYIINNKLRKSKNLTATIKHNHIRTSVAYKIYFNNYKNIKSIIEKSKETQNISEFCCVTGIPRFIVFKLPSLKYCIDSKKKCEILNRINNGTKLISILDCRYTIKLLKHTLMEAVVVNNVTKETRLINPDKLRKLNMKNIYTDIKDIIGINDNEKLVHETQTFEFIIKILSESIRI